MGTLTIHYYSALSVCKCFLTTRDSPPACFPHSPSGEADEPDGTVNARFGKRHTTGICVSSSILSALSALDKRRREILLIGHKVHVYVESRKRTYNHYSFGVSFTVSMLTILGMNLFQHNLQEALR